MRDMWYAAVVHEAPDESLRTKTKQHNKSNVMAELRDEFEFVDEELLNSLADEIILGAEEIFA